MMIQRTENEAATAPSTSARETDIESGARQEPIRTALAGFAAPTGTVSVGYRIGEALCVTVALAVITLLSRVAWSLLVPVMIGNTSIRGGLPWWVEAFSFALAVIASAVIGVAVGMGANRRTMIGSLIAAHVTVSVGWQVYMLLAFPKLFGFGWQFTASMLVSSVFGLLTIALTDIAVALFVARKFRKSP